MVKSILIDTDIGCLNTLNGLINHYCPKIDVSGQYVSILEGLSAIEQIKPDLIFIDVETHTSLNGISVLEEIAKAPSSIIITSQTDQYAIKAIHLNIMDYLLKPIEPSELLHAIHKFYQHNHLLNHEPSQIMTYHKCCKNEMSKIAIPTSDGFELIAASQIIRCEADDNYTYVHLKNKNKIIVCRSLKDFENHLEDFPNFVRVHNSFIANLNEAEKYVRGGGGYLIMSDGSCIHVSRSHKENLMKYFNV